MNYKEYKEGHKTTGCRALHMIGIPTILISFPVALFDLRLAAFLFFTGWFMQFSGHLFFEKNKPSFLSGPTALMYSVIFWFDEIITIVLRVKLMVIKFIKLGGFR